jgi:oligo-1,6-glucosidase
MQWDTSDNAGFCKDGVKPWMRVMDDYKHGINAQEQMDCSNANELSTWQFWQRGILDRKKHANVFVYGDYQELSPDDASVLAYVRTSQSGEKWLVVLNFSGQDLEWTLPRPLEAEFWACSTYSKGQSDKPREGSIPLSPWEGLLAKCKA